MSIDISTRQGGGIRVVSPADLQAYVDTLEKEALGRHTRSIQAVLSLSGVLYYEDSESALRARLGENSPDKQADLPDNPFRLLGDVAVKSVMLSHRLYAAEKNIPVQDTMPQRDNWRIKTRNDIDKNSSIRFFVAKSEVAEIELDNGITAEVVERRTFAAVSANGNDSAREIDIKHVLGSAQRHPLDSREILVAPTSLSFYAKKSD